MWKKKVKPIPIKVKYGQVKQSFLNGLLVKYIVEHRQTFQSVQSNEFLKLVKALDPKYVVLDERTIKELI